MTKLNIHLGERSYPIYITTDFDSIYKNMDYAGINGKIVVITDSKVDKCQGDEFLSGLKQYGGPIYKYVIEAGEKSKTLDTVKAIYKFLIENKTERNSTLVALGGGVVGDIAGFAAATFYRGLNFVQVPTTLLAQADSSVGGKVGVDFEGNKNVIGAFYQPRFVYINVNTLRTLPERELKSGLAEVIKHGIIMDEEFFDYIDDNMEKIFNFNEDVLQYLAKVNCTIKGTVVEQDEKESGLRAILNFGHTFGHAIESAFNFEYLHGECVALGIAAAFKTAQYLNITNPRETERVTRVLQKAGLPVKMKKMDINRIYEQMYSDKKVKKDTLLFVLPKKVGEVVQITLDDESLIKRVLSELMEA
ncbi:MAG: 3-dehydroquinate synthase [Clostridiales bacterium]|jgi:3-dehydroquinate synthase|nr:3-dehydroquinate synthase [Eubacteriales bacterium]MDH7565208.1 3-dehydroquinate synthase [Clostridiales bacterium]